MGKREGLIDEPQDWSKFPDLQAMEFDALITEYRRAHDAEEWGKATKKSLSPQIQAALLIVGQKSVKVNNMTALVSNGSTAERIDANKLLLAGVSADIIKACTIPGTRYTYAQVRVDKEVEGEPTI
jgi:hypothetical protein